MKEEIASELYRNFYEALYYRTIWEAIGLGRFVNDFCRNCGDEKEEETIIHLLGTCPVLGRRGKKFLGSWWTVMHWYWQSEWLHWKLRTVAAHNSFEWIANSDNWFGHLNVFPRRYQFYCKTWNSLCRVELHRKQSAIYFKYCCRLKNFSSIIIRD